ncbi:hypothetical protein OK348_07100 [Flavobacterium sp. MXW15]|uniref:Tetratricopeptide repeat protein n=1 Tax=Xanthomonas chitinilytica TaxID=2989819 RepID=A0ABT3JUJ9_9XANT|nr:tetratricopeptide repeat protein [Xanthomonas sp. H13-6]MCW4454561.1 hypothetical protein [Flavobacterium sp. MXW15]MCW4471800.1 hypothetical protein [Xanthomonas sp. H13-6]
MSLIYDALREQAGPAMPGRLPARASWWSRRCARGRTAVLLAAAALLAVAVLLLVASRFPRAAAPDTVVVQPSAVDAGSAATADAPAEPPVAASMSGQAAPPPAIATTDAATAQAVPAQPQPASPPAAATALAATDIAAAPERPATAPPPVAAAAVAEAAPQPIKITVERRTGAGHDRARPAAAADDGTVERTIGSVEAAMAGNDLEAARQALARLDAQLPAESLTLLRMHAWVAHGSNDTATAEKLYRQIVERVPDDMNAGVNIALLDARRGDLDQARHRLVRLSGRYPRAPQVSRALAELDAQQQ